EPGSAEDDSAADIRSDQREPLAREHLDSALVEREPSAALAPGPDDPERRGGRHRAAVQESPLHLGGRQAEIGVYRLGERDAEIDVAGEPFTYPHPSDRQEAGVQIAVHRAAEERLFVER